ncbi:MAG: phage recombination protein Bet [Mesorhizobium sp.]
MAQAQQRAQSHLPTVERLAPMRLPVSAGMLGQLSVSEAEWRVLTDQIFPSARSVEAINLALAYCRSRNLDILKKPVHIVPMYSSILKRMVETVWPSIAEIRTTATRTKAYAGIDEAVYGPEIETEFVQKIEDERDPRSNRSVAHRVKYPEWCKLTVYRFVQGQRCAFHAQVFWNEAYATSGRNTDMPNEMWRKRPCGQLEKCTEAAALRKAFPEELGNTYAAEEMEGHTIEGEVAYAVPPEPARPKEPPPVRPKAPPPTANKDRHAEKEATGKVIEAEIHDITDDPWEGDDTRYFDELRDRLAEAPDAASIEEVWQEFDPLARFEKSPLDQDIAIKIRNLRLSKLERANAVTS